MLPRQAHESIVKIPGIDADFLKVLPDINTIVACLYKCGIFDSENTDLNAARFKELLATLEGTPGFEVQEAAQIYVMVTEVLPLSYDQHRNLITDIVKSKSLSLNDFVELKNIFGQDRWNSTLVQVILQNSRSIMKVVRQPDFDIDALYGLMMDITVREDDLHSFLDAVAFFGSEKYMTRALSSRLIENYKSAYMIVRTLSYLHHKFGDEFTKYIDDVFAGRLTLDNVNLLSNKDEKSALDKLTTLCNALDETLVSTKPAAPDEDTKNAAKQKIYDLEFDRVFHLRVDDIPFGDINSMCEKLKILRSENIYHRILDKITHGEAAISVEELAYFAMITDQPELINLYDLRKCLDAVGYERLKLNFEILIGLRARKDKHFSKYHLEMLDKVMAAHDLSHETQPLFATRLCRKLDAITAKLRAEPYYQSLVEKVKKRERLSDEETLYFALLTDNDGLYSSACFYHISMYTSCLEKIENEYLREVFKQKINMMICLRGHSDSNKEDQELIAKMRERGANARGSNATVQFLNLENVDLSDIDLIGNDFLVYVNLKGAKLEYAQLDQARHVNFNRAHMRCAGIYNRVNDEYKNWDSCNFNDADLSKSKVRKPHLSKCTFVKTNFEEAHVYLSKSRDHNDADFTEANFNSATMKNFNACVHGVKHVSVVGATLTNSLDIFKDPEAIDELFSFTDVATLNRELHRLEILVMANTEFKDDIKLAAARHIKKRAMANAIEDLNLHRDLMDAACAHSVFQPESKTARAANDVVTFASSTIHGWFSQGVDTTRPWYSTPALDILIPARDELREQAARTIYL